MVGIFMGSLFTWKYIEGEDNRKNYATTTCLVIGSNLACYYDPADVDSVILEFPDSKSELNYACAAFGISAVLGICILLIFIYKARMDRLKNTKQDKDHVELGELMNTSTN
ncbi:unnamed protein product [Adineta steineri]|uniref:Uncharacterized protein n=2 Tax=Adineta steineri TaxID=433720 RepID=A0A818U4P7_9BILA|nr:unnamed protein product [Adineta steineri]CAF3695532.1 unnamed protein product [Adineta steineri]